MNSPIAIWRKHQKLHKYLGKSGELLVWTKLYVAPTGFEHQVPYIVGMVDFGQGDKQLLEIVDTEEEVLKINQKVEVVIRRVGKSLPEEVIEYGIKVTPI